MRIDLNDLDEKACALLKDNSLELIQYIPTTNNMHCYCGFCGQSIVIESEDEVCPTCKNDLIFPRADW